MRDLTFGVPGDIMPPADAMLERARKNEKDGWDAIWWPDHLMGWHATSIWTPDITPLANVQTSPHVWFDPVPVLGAAAAVTDRVQLGTCVTDPIRRPAPILAQTFLTLDHISRGRAIMGLGSGESLNLEPYGLPADKMVSRFEESIKVVRMFFETDEPINFDGQFTKIKDGLIGLRPYTPGGPPIWIAAHRPRMLRITGEYGDGWLPTKMEPDEYAAGLKTIRDVSENVGRARDHVVAGMLSYVLCAETESQLEELLEKPLIKGLCLLLPAEVFTRFGHEPPFGEGSYGFHDFVPSRYPREEALKVMNRVPPEVVRYYCLAGTPDMLLEQLLALRGAGLEHVVFWNITAFADPKLAGFSFRTLKELRGELLQRV
jgi:phthiodiolone/phenolphthiodiolone dimycocerosates ketoreductase